MRQWVDDDVLFHIPCRKCDILCSLKEGKAVQNYYEYLHDVISCAMQCRLSAGCAAEAKITLVCTLYGSCAHLHQKGHALHVAICAYMYTSKLPHINTRTSMPLREAVPVVATRYPQYIRAGYRPMAPAHEHFLDEHKTSQPIIVEDKSVGTICCVSVPGFSSFCWSPKLSGLSSSHPPPSPRFFCPKSTRARQKSKCIQKKEKALLADQDFTV
jgi:hypothetical protein